MVGSPLNAAGSDNRASGTARTFGTFIGGLLCGGLIFWAGHEFWPNPGSVKLNGSGSGLSPVSMSGKVSSEALTRNTISNIASEASKSVVNINTQTEVADEASPFGGNGFHFFFNDQQPDAEGLPNPHKMRELGSGSGVIIRPDGYILTNNHVVRKATDIKVTLSDKRTFNAKVVGRDSFTDLALLKVDATDLPAAKLGDSKNIRPGDFAIAIGSPVGLDQTVTMGIVSALGRSLTSVGNGISLIQTDAAINPGNSGGPLINIDGEVVGINTAIRGDAQNIGFSIPIDIANKVANDLLEHKNPSHPYIGILMKDMDEELAKSLGVSAASKGVVVARVQATSPAAQAGLQVGDLIQKVDGQLVSSSKELQTMVRNHKTGDDLHFLILRGNSLEAVTVKIGDFPSDEKSQG
jgi:Do/DeqQ family serine protease